MANRPAPTLEQLAASPVVTSPTKVHLDGVAFDPVTEEEAVQHVMVALDDGRGGMLLTPNVDILRQLRAPRLRAIADSADLVVADGMPLVWASRLQGQPLPERVTGASLAASLPAALASQDRSVYLLGGEEGVAEAAALALVDEHEDLRVAGWHCPPHGFERDEIHVERMLAELRRTKPDLVLVGLGFPKQENLIARLREALPQAWFVGCGGALTFLAGFVPRAPERLQRSGLEWVHRLAKEPRRMARRYLVDDLPYAAGLLVRSARRAGGSARAA